MQVLRGRPLVAITCEKIRGKGGYPRGKSVPFPRRQNSRNDVSDKVWGTAISYWGNGSILAHENGRGKCWGSAYLASHMDAEARKSGQTGRTVTSELSGALTVCLTAPVSARFQAS